MVYDRSKLSEKNTSISVENSTPFEELDLDFLFHYQIFPPHIMSFYTQWQDEQRKMEVGDTIVQQVYLPPIRSFSQKIVF